MAQVTNTFDTFSAKGIREQLADIIYNIDPTDVPFMSGIRKGTATNTYFEWQLDHLDAAANNAQIQGDDVSSFQSVTPTTRVGNRTQISRKAFVISGTEEVVNKAGRKSEIAYQIARFGKSLKRDMETALLQNTTAVTGSSSVASQTNGLEGWIATNNNLGTGGVAPNPTTNTAPTDGTARAFTEAMLKDVLQKCFTNGGNPDTLMCGPTQRQVVSTFTGNSTRFDKGEDKSLTATVAVYISDFGELKVVANRFQRNRTAFALQMDMFQLNYLRPFQTVELAKTGDAEKRMILAEYGLQSNQEAASGAIRDLS